MPRIIITSGADVVSEGFGRPCMLDELVSTDYLNDDYASLRLLERICWAIEDAEEQERDDAVRAERVGHHLADEMQRRDRAILGMPELRHGSGSSARHPRSHGRAPATDASFSPPATCGDFRTRHL